MRTRSIAVATLALLSATAAFADIPDLYNAVRCRRVDDPTVAVHLAIVQNRPQSLFWIEHDRVTLLSNELETSGSIVKGRETGGSENYELDYQAQTFTVTDDQGAELRKESHLSCVMCPADLDYCPGDEPGHGTNVPPHSR